MICSMYEVMTVEIPKNAEGINGEVEFHTQEIEKLTDVRDKSRDHIRDI